MAMDATGPHHLDRATRVAAGCAASTGSSDRSRPMAGIASPATHPRPGHGGRLHSRRGAIREATLALLAEQPMHGYQVMQELGERSGGRWRPSAGSVYPTLQQLEDEGLVTVEDRDGRGPSR